MAETESMVRKWGNSLGLIIPKNIIEKEHIKENEVVSIDIKKKHKAREFFGMLSGWKDSTDKIKREMKKGWE